MIRGIHIDINNKTCDLIYYKKVPVLKMTDWADYDTVTWNKSTTTSSAPKGPGRESGVNVSNVDFSRAMLNQRNEKKLTQKDLATRTGIPQSDIAAFEIGKRAPNPQQRTKLQTHLGKLPNLKKTRPMDDPSE